MPASARNSTGKAAGAKGMPSSAARLTAGPSVAPGAARPERSPLTSATNTGTPALESCSARPCRVLVLPVPVAPATRPWRLIMPRGTVTTAAGTTAPSCTPRPRSRAGPSVASPAALVGRSASGGAASCCSEPQKAHLRAPCGISLRHSGHCLVSGSAPRARRSASLFIGATTTKYTAAATSRNVMSALMNRPYLKMLPLIENARPEKSGLPKIAAISGVIRLSTKALTTAPKAAPMTTATARSTTLPRRMKSRNPLIMALPSDGVLRAARRVPRRALPLLTTSYPRRAAAGTARRRSAGIAASLRTQTAAATLGRLAGRGAPQRRWVMTVRTADDTSASPPARSAS